MKMSSNSEMSITIIQYAIKNAEGSATTTAQTLLLSILLIFYRAGLTMGRFAEYVAALFFHTLMLDLNMSR